MRRPRLPGPDFRPSRADAEARFARKALEKENPHFNMQEFGMKAGALALLTAVALFPWEKEYEKHERTHHPERFEDEKGKDKKGSRGGKDEGRGDDREGGRGRDGRRGDEGDRRRRRQSEGGEREREYRTYLDRDREYRALEVDGPSAVESQRGVDGRRYTGSEDGEYGRRYIEAKRNMDRNEGRRRGSVDYEYRRSSRDERRR